MAEGAEEMVVGGGKKERTTEDGAAWPIALGARSPLPLRAKRSLNRIWTRASRGGKGREMASRVDE